jgi:hypothetical protein
MSTNGYPVVLEACAGLSVAPVVWAVNTQLGQILPYLDCQHQSRYSAIASFAAAIAACAAGAISWRAAHRALVSEQSSATVLGFIGSTGALSALIFAFALLMQGAASLVVSGCER